ncbi:MAG: PTS sugar transporter subunit IIA [Rickettsiales bacterium]|nr:PTS sugar transporter subunit IIA [Rickettsiales bacterium]
MQIATLLMPEAVLAKFAARDKKHALRQLAAHAAKLTRMPEKEIYAVLLERENIGCTGMGHGVCIPHGRFTELTKVHAVFAQLEKPISFGAADGKPIDLLFLLLSPMDAHTEHMKALASISRVLRDKLLCENLRRADTALVLHALLTDTRTENVA